MPRNTNVIREIKKMTTEKYGFRGTRREMLQESGLSVVAQEALLHLGMEVRQQSSLNKMKACLIFCELALNDPDSRMNFAATLGINTMAKDFMDDRETLAKWIEAVMEGVTIAEKQIKEDEKCNA